MDAGHRGQGAMESTSGGSAIGNDQQQEKQQQPPTRIQKAPTDDESLDYSAEQYYAQAHGQYKQYHEQSVDPSQQQLRRDTPTVDEHQVDDATPMVHEMHRNLLHLLSHPELFSRAIDWQSKVDRGMDPSRPTNEDGAGLDGMKSFDNEFNEDQSLATTGAAEEQKDEVDHQPTSVSAGSIAAADQADLIPPLPLRIFAADAEVNVHGDILFVFTSADSCSPALA